MSNTNQVLTEAEIVHIKNGFAHMVDNGYGRLATARDVIKVLAVKIERSKRELLISKESGFDCKTQEAMLQADCLMLDALLLRI